jgi:hypothetical protein
LRGPLRGRFFIWLPVAGILQSVDLFDSVAIGCWLPATDFLLHCGFGSPGVSWQARPQPKNNWPLTTGSQFSEVIMQNPTQPAIQLTNTADYRENYANSVQVRVNVWDFFLVFGTLQQQDETHVDVRNFQGIYLSPQQAKALYTILQQNLVNYENTFGEIKLDPRMQPGAGPVH